MKWLLILIIAGIVLSTPHIIRLAEGNPYPLSSEGYAVLHEAALVRAGSSLDPLSGKEVVPDVHTYLAAGLLGIMQPFLLAKVLPYIMGLLAGVLFFAFARKVMNERAAIIAGLLFVTSPAFVYTFSTFNRWYLTVVLVLFALYFFAERKQVLCAAVSGLVLVASPLVFLLLTAIFIIRPPQDWRRFFAIFGVISLVAGIFFSLFLHSFAMPVFTFSQFLVDFGAPFGIDVALLILAAIGLSLVSKRIAVAVIVLAAAALFNPFILLFFCLLIPLFAGLAGDYVLGRSWSLPNMKQLTILVIVCALLFSVTSYEKQIGAAEPQPFFVRAIENIPESQGAVLAPQAYAPYIQYFAGRRVVSPQGNDTFNAIYQSRDLKKTEELLDTNQIDTFFVSGEMREGLIWGREGEGLDFLLPHSERFVNVYQFRKGSQTYDVWVYRPKPKA
jgi:hypothetical protein